MKSRHEQLKAPYDYDPDGREKLEEYRMEKCKNPKTGDGQTYCSLVFRVNGFFATTPLSEGKTIPLSKELGKEIRKNLDDVEQGKGNIVSYAQREATALKKVVPQISAQSPRNYTLLALFKGSAVGIPAAAYTGHYLREGMKQHQSRKLGRTET